MIPESGARRRSWLRWSRLLVPVGTVLLLGVWTRATPHGLLGKADAIGYAVCHRIDLRSFHFGERALPLCSRCTGMYLGAAASLVYLQTAGRQGAGGYPTGRGKIALGAMGAAFLIDGVNSFLQAIPNMPHLYTPRNDLRLATGLLGGLALGVVVFAAFQQSVWKSWRAERALARGRDWAVVLGIVSALYVAVSSENPLLLYPLAIASSASVLGLLTIVFAVLVLTLRRRENEAISWRGLALPLVSGFGLALIQIGALDAIRFALTGTWSGFTL